MRWIVQGCAGWCSATIMPCTRPDFGNPLNIEAVRRYPGRLRAYCGINPNYPDLVAQDLATYDEYPDVYVGLKMLADYHGFPLTHERYRAAWELADRKALPVLIHTWGHSPFDGPEIVRQIAERYPNVRLLIGHSCHDEWDKAVALVNDFPNLYFELCAVLDERGILEKFVKEAGSERIVFGTDLPVVQPSLLHRLGAGRGYQRRRPAQYSASQCRETLSALYLGEKTRRH